MKIHFYLCFNDFARYLPREWRCTHIYQDKFLLEDTNPVSWSCLCVGSSLHAFIEFSLPLQRHATVMMMCDINSIEIRFSYNINTWNMKKRKILLWRNLLQVFSCYFSLILICFYAQIILKTKAIDEALCRIDSFLVDFFCLYYYAYIYCLFKVLALSGFLLI